MNNARYAQLLEQTAALLHIRGDNPFRIRAFEKAARVIEGLDEEIELLLDEDRVDGVPGIGKSIAADLHELRERRSTGLLDELRAELPAGILDLLRISGLGPKKVQKLYRELGIGDLAALRDAAERGQIATLDGFGAKTQERILIEIERLDRYADRTPFAVARPIADRIVDALRALDAVQRAEVAGSLRRARETVGDLDFVVASDDPAAVSAAFTALDDVVEVVASGSTKTTVLLDGGLSADLRVVPPDVFGATLHHFTGSKDHNVAMRSRAQKAGLRISEYGVFQRDGDQETPIACRTEEDVFAAVGLPWIAPELREDRGEIDRAEAGALPDLVTVEAIVSDLHMHTVASDGQATIEQMADAAHERGLTHIAITDHSRSLHVARGLDRDRLLEQIDAIEAFNATGHPVRVLAGLEADILEDGSVDMDDDVLERLDWVVGSVHQWMNQPEHVMTDRIERAVRSGWLSALGHPTGRLIGQRDGYAFDFERVCRACAELGVALEVNAAPERLDLNDSLLRRALEHDGITFTINTDAHSVRGFRVLPWGVGMARRGWVPAARVLNTLPLDRFLETRRKPARAT